MFERCKVMTPGQRARLAIVSALLGAAAAVGLDVALERAMPSPVAPLTPVLERAGQDWTVLRVPFARRGAEVSCYVALFHDRGTWTVTC